MIHHKSIQVKNTPIKSRPSPAAALGLRPSSAPKGADHRSPPPLGPTLICYVAVRCLSRRYLLPLRVTWHRRLLTQSSAASASSLSRRRETSDANSCMLRPSPSGVRMCMSSLRPASLLRPAASCITFYLKVLMDFEDDDGGEPVSVRGGVGKKRMFQINELLLSYFCHDQVHTFVASETRKSSAHIGEFSASSQRGRGQY